MKRTTTTETPDPRWFDPVRDRFWAEYYKIENPSEFIFGGDFCCVKGKWYRRESAIAQKALKKWRAERPTLGGGSCDQG